MLRTCMKFYLFLAKQCVYANRVCNFGLWVEVVENTAISNTELIAC